MRRRSLLKYNDRGSAEGHDWIKIGGVKWATMNIGANSETDYGLYFQWGDTAGYTSGQCSTSGTTYAKPFTWRDYKFGNGTSASTASSMLSAMTKYNSSDNKKVLEPSDDAATLYWGGDWRMPTKSQFEELTANTTQTVTTVSGVRGMRFSGNGDSIFLPFGGYIDDACDENDVGDAAQYLTSTPGGTHYCWVCRIDDSNSCGVNSYGREECNLVRGVIDS